MIEGIHQFKDRKEAAKMLAASLVRYRGQNPLVLSIPRGGVPIGKVIADAILGEHNVVLVHKLGHPNNPEYAFGAIDEDGTVYLEKGEPAHRDIEKAQLAKLTALRKKYTPLRPPSDPKDRIVIIVDDGIATGWTVKAAVAYLTRALAGKIIVAVPVGAPDSIEALETDPRIAEVICLKRPRRFMSVGDFYKDFSQVTDDEVEKVLASGENTYEN